MEIPVKWTPSNKVQFTPDVLNKMNLVQKSRYMAYEPISPHVAASHLDIVRRVAALRRLQNIESKPEPPGVVYAREKSIKIMAWLKAAEASLRTLEMSRNYYIIYMHAIEKILAGRSAALEAMRMETLIMDTPQDKVTGLRRLSHVEKKRLEYLLETAVEY